MARNRQSRVQWGNSISIPTTSTNIASSVHTKTTPTILNLDYCDLAKEEEDITPIHLESHDGIYYRDLCLV